MAKKLILSTVAGAVVLTGLYAAAGYVGVPAGIKWAINTYATPALGGRDLQISSIDFNPWQWSLEIRDVSIGSSANPESKMLTLDRLVADVSSQSLFKLAPIVERFRVEGLHATLTNLGQHQGEIERVVGALSPDTASDRVFELVSAAHAATGTGMTLPAFSLSNVAVVDSSLVFKNPKAGKTLSLTDMTFSLPRISTIDADVGAIPNVEPGFSMLINGKPVQAEGRTRDGVATLDLSIDNVDVANAVQALALDLPVRLTSLNASVLATATYDLSDASGTAVTLKGKVSGSNATFATTDTLYSGSVQAFGVEIKAFDLAKRQVDVDYVYVTHPVIKAGFASQTTESPAAAQAGSGQAGVQPQAPAWRWSVNEAAITKGDVTLTDVSLKPAGTLRMTNISASVKNIGSHAKEDGTYSASMQLAKGQLKTSGTVRAEPLRVHGSTELKGFPFSPLNPWIRSLSGAQIDSGTMTLTGQLDYDAKGKVQVAWKGNASVDNFTAIQNGKTLVSWKSVGVENAQASVAEKPEVFVGLLRIEDPMQQVTQKTDNLLSLFGQIAAATGHEKTAKRAEKYKAKSHRLIEIKDIVYADNQFSVHGYNKGSLEALAVEKLNKVFAKQ